MNVLRKRALRVLVLFFMACVLMGSTVAWAAPMLWSYPNDHLLITEVYSQGSPGEGEGTEWIEIYNPTGADIEHHGILITGNGGQVMIISTPTRVAGEYTPYPPIRSHCSLYLAHDATIFFNRFGQCPDFAVNKDLGICDDTRDIYGHPNLTRVPINDGNETLCLRLMPYSNELIDAVGWGTGGDGSSRCSVAENPIAFGTTSPVFGTASPWETYLRGGDNPVWIGPGAEGEEIAGNPYSEQLEEVWNLSRNIDVPWEGVETACRLPTAVQLKQTPQATMVQSGGYVAVLVGIVGLLTLALIFVWSKRDLTQP